MFDPSNGTFCKLTFPGDSNIHVNVTPVSFRLPPTPQFLNVNIKIPEADFEFKGMMALLGMRCLWEIGCWGIEDFDVTTKPIFCADGSTLSNARGAIDFKGKHHSRGYFEFSIIKDENGKCVLVIADEVCFFSSEELERLESEALSLIFDPFGEISLDAVSRFVNLLDDENLAMLYEDLLGFYSNDPEHIPYVVSDVVKIIDYAALTQRDFDNAELQAFKIGELLLEYVEVALASRHREYLEISIQGDASILKRAISCIANSAVSASDEMFDRVIQMLSKTPPPRFIEDRHTLFSDVPSQALLAMLVILDTRNVIPMPE